jgi:hypothetical protein
LWEKNLPKAPTKCLDYLIAKVCFSLQTLDPITAVNNVVGNIIVKDQDVAELALLWLRFQMYSAKYNIDNTQRISIEDHYKIMNASLDNIEESKVIGQQLLNTIEQTIKSNAKKIEMSLTDDYLIGYHIGDGSFYMVTQISPTSFKATLTWSLTDCRENYFLLFIIKNKLIKDGYKNLLSIREYDNNFTLASTIRHTNKDVLFFEHWVNKSLPQRRRSQRYYFLAARKLYNSKDFRASFSKIEEFIQIKWSMNYLTNGRKTGSLEKDLEKVKKWFNNPYRRRSR